MRYVQDYFKSSASICIAIRVSNTYYFKCKCWLFMSTKLQWLESYKLFPPLFFQLKCTAVLNSWQKHVYSMCQTGIILCYLPMKNSKVFSHMHAVNYSIGKLGWQLLRYYPTLPLFPVNYQRDHGNAKFTVRVT